VDSSIVFIDPISFSVLKKVTLRYQDYEIPATLRKSIMTLRGIFDSLKTNKGKDMSTIFLDLLDRDSEEIEIRHFVNHLMDLEVDIERDHLYKIMRTLDADGSGSISLDEFLNFFGMIKNEEEEAQKAREEHMLHDELWPQWLIRDDKLSTAQNLLANMAHHLATVHGFTAEAAFALYDTRDDGAISHEQFMLIMNIFFSEILTESEIEFLTRLCVYRND
jgi:Ca2+-binding EF-hand superfamily protein